MRAEIILWALLPASSLSFQQLSQTNVQPSLLARTTRRRPPPTSLFVIDPNTIVTTTPQEIFSGGNLPQVANERLFDVPPDFFTVTAISMGILASFLKRYRRWVLQERAFDLRLEEAQNRALAADPSLTERDVRLAQAANPAIGWSAYGPYAREQEEKRKQERLQAKEAKKKKKLMSMDEEYDEEYEAEEEEEDMTSLFRMSEEEIEEFELTYGVEYDPYYDEPYFEDELPDDIKFMLDRQFGDRIYENGEIFYKTNDVYYRQGSVPRKIVSKLGWPPIIQNFLDKQAA